MTRPVIQHTSRKFSREETLRILRLTDSNSSETINTSSSQPHGAMDIFDAILFAILGSVLLSLILAFVGVLLHSE